MRDGGYFDCTALTLTWKILSWMPLVFLACMILLFLVHFRAFNWCEWIFCRVCFVVCSQIFWLFSWSTLFLTCWGSLVTLGWVISMEILRFLDGSIVMSLLGLWWGWRPALGAGSVKRCLFFWKWVVISYSSSWTLWNWLFIKSKWL